MDNADSYSNNDVLHNMIIQGGKHRQGCSCKNCTSGISIVEHDGALAGSFEKTVDRRYNDLDTLIVDSMKKVESFTNNNNGVVGHIKASLCSKERVAMYSLTEDIVNKKGDLNIEIIDKIYFASIVYGVNQEEFRELLKNIKDLL